MTRVLPPELAGEFFGVGSVGERSPDAPLEYVSRLPLPYVYQLPTDAEDMIRQFACLVDGFEEEDTYTLDVDMAVYRDVTEGDSPLLPDPAHDHALYALVRDRHYRHLKTQQTAPMTMCFSIHSSDGAQHVSLHMLYFYTALMRRVAAGQYEHLSGHCDWLVLCQDDPALGLVLQSLANRDVPGLTLRRIVQLTDSVYPPGVAPAFHYCDDWRAVLTADWHALWDGRPRIVHVDLVSFAPEVSSEQAEKMNHFLERGGAIAMGVLPNVDSAYAAPVRDTLRHNLSTSLAVMVESGVDIDLLAEAAMVSTQCGLSRASPELTREVHLLAAGHIAEVFRECVVALR